MTRKNEVVLKLLKSWNTSGVLESKHDQWLQQECRRMYITNAGVENEALFRTWLSNEVPMKYASALSMVGRAFEQIASRDASGLWLRLMDLNDWQVPRPNWNEQIVRGQVVSFLNVRGILCDCHPNPNAEYWAALGHIELKAVALCVGQAKDQSVQSNLCLVVKRRGVDPNAYALVHVNQQGHAYPYCFAPSLVYDAYVSRQFGFVDSELVCGGLRHGVGLDGALGFTGAGRFVGENLHTLEAYLVQLTAGLAQHRYSADA